jgi:ferredoxin-NADP reductase
VTVLLRASTHDQLVLHDDVVAEVQRRGGRLIERVGSRRDVPLDAAALRELVPDVGRRQVYLCGPDDLAQRLAAELRTAGVRDDRIHFESFTF